MVDKLTVLESWETTSRIRRRSSICEIDVGWLKMRPNSKEDGQVMLPAIGEEKFSSG